jgi:hypothetical protein
LTRGSLNSAHIHGTDVPVEEPSTASNSEVELADADFCFTPESGRPADGLGCPFSAKTGLARRQAIRCIARLQFEFRELLQYL